MQISIDHRAGTPIYIQIMDQIRHQMASGDLKVGDQLPTVRQLAADLRVNWNTVARAYRLLDDAGLISTQQGRGTYVWEKPTEEADQALRLMTLQALAHQYLHEANKLGFDPAEAARAVSGEAARIPAGLEDPASFEDRESR